MADEKYDIGEAWGPPGESPLQRLARMEPCFPHELPPIDLSVPTVGPLGPLMTPHYNVPVATGGDIEQARERYGPLQDQVKLSEGDDRTYPWSAIPKLPDQTVGVFWGGEWYPLVDYGRSEYRADGLDGVRKRLADRLEKMARILSADPEADEPVIVDARGK